MYRSRRTRRRGKETTASLTTQQATTTATTSIRHLFGDGGVPGDGPLSSIVWMSRLLQDACSKCAYMRLAWSRRGVRLNCLSCQQYRAFLLARAAVASSSAAAVDTPSSSTSSALARWPSPFPSQSCRRGLRVEPHRDSDKVILAAMRGRGETSGVRSGEVAAESTC